MGTEREVLAKATPAAIATATTWELYDVIGELVILAAHLRSMSAAQAPIEQAKGVIMALYGVDEQTAFDFLQHRSQDSNVKLHDVAGATLREHGSARHPGPLEDNRTGQVRVNGLKGVLATWLLKRGVKIGPNSSHPDQSSGRRESRQPLATHPLSAG